MPLWRRNLWVCWFGMFVTGIGMSQIAPVLPLYIRSLGVTDPGAIERYAGLAFGVTFVVSAVFSPIWGRAADLVGRKPMLLRASLGMAVVIFSMGFAPNVYVLILLRILQGAITGYSTACTTLIATQTDSAHAGYALGTLSTANVAGSLLGPAVGGFIGDHVGFRPVFYIIGGLMMIAFLTTLFFVKENFVRVETAHVPRMREIWSRLPERRMTLVLFVTYFIITMGLYTIEPIVTVYVTQMDHDERHVALIAGVVFSAAGFANILSAPRLGRLSDRIGPHKVMLAAVAAAGLLYIPQAFVHTPWQLMGLRFLLGLTMGGLAPSVHTLVRKITPDEFTGRIFGFSIAAGYLGTFCGSNLGGQTASAFGTRSVFFITSALLLANAVWVYLQIYRRLAKTDVDLRRTR